MTEILTSFSGNPILETLVKICNCVGGANIREYFPMEVFLNPSYNWLVNLGRLLV